MSQCSQQRRKDGLAYPRTCQKCGLGPCTVFPPVDPGPPPNQTSGGQPLHAKGCSCPPSSELASQRWDCGRKGYQAAQSGGPSK